LAETLLSMSAKKFPINRRRGRASDLRRGAPIHLNTQRERVPSQMGRTEGFQARTHERKDV